MPHLIQIGNSQGIRIPRAVIQQANLSNKELVFKVTHEGLLISPINPNPRADWSQKIQEVLAKHPEALELTQEDREWLDADLSDEGDYVW